MPAPSQVVIGCELRGSAPADQVLGAIPEVTSRLVRGPGNSSDDTLLALADPYLRWIVPARTSTDDFAWVG